MEATMGMSDFGGEATDITKLLMSLIDSDSIADPILVITTDGSLSNATGMESAQDDRFLQLLKEFGIFIVRAAPSNDLYRDFAEIDSIRRMLIQGYMGDE